MKKIILLLLFVIINNSYAQLGDILKKIPGVEDVFPQAVSTSIKDAYPTAYWLKDLDKQIQVNADESYSSDLSPGYYKFDFKTFCLHAGGYASTEGAGYLAAPLKGTKAKLIQNVLTRYDDHQEIDQRDVQLLIWGIEAGQKFSSYATDFQLRVTPLLTPDEIASMEVDVKEIAMDILPQDVKDILNLYKDLRSKLSDVNASYEQVEQIAVKTGIPPLGKGSRNVEKGTWSSVGNGIYLRAFSDFYTRSQVELYIPPEVQIQKDNSGRIVSLDDGTYRIELQYEGSSSKFKSALLKNFSSNEEVPYENTTGNNKAQVDEFVNLVKKSFGKKKHLNDESLKTLAQLKSIELTLNSLIDKNTWQSNVYRTSVNSLGSYISGLESGKIKGGSERMSGFDIHGVVFAPGNTAVQRRGNGGNGKKEKEKECKPEITLKRVSENYLPEAGYIVEMYLNINNPNEEKCHAERIKWELSDVTSDLGNCINDKNPDNYNHTPDFGIYPNLQYVQITTSDNLVAEGPSNFNPVRILCSDYGAWAKLSAKVKINGDWYTAKDEGSAKEFVTIPLDENENKIADKWEKDNKVFGLPASWDEDAEPSGQSRNGDGLTNYEEYRGCYVLDEPHGFMSHIRTNPNKKEIFVIDNDNIFVSFSWEKASDIHAYYLDERCVFSDLSGGTDDFPEWKRINFCSGYAKGEKFCINLIKVTGFADPYGVDQNPTVWGYCDIGPPKKVKRAVIFPDRRREWVKQITDTVYYLLQTFPSQQNFVLGGKTFTRQAMEDFVNIAKDPQKRNMIVEFLVNRTVIHELGHGCGMQHHSPTDGGDAGCPMRYIDKGDVLTFADDLSDLFAIVDKGWYVIPIYTGWRFCSAPDNNWSQIDVNDR